MGGEHAGGARRAGDENAAEAARPQPPEREAQVADGAVVRGSVRLGRGTRIGRGCIIEGDVEIGDGTRIDDYCIVRGRVRIGEDNWLYPFCTIGTGPQHFQHLEDASADPATDPARGEVRIGSDNIMREYASIHMPAVGERTSIGSHCHMLAYAHVSHDSAIGDGVTMANGTTIGGHSQVGNGANLGFNVSVHPYCRIGPHSMVAMMMPVVKDVPPYALVNRQRFARVNEVGMRRAGMGADEIGAVREAYGLLGGQGAAPAAATASSPAASRFAAEIRAFVDGSRRGCYLPA